ncbi:hypothetical protein [Nocardia sp. NPDC051463]|uniref:hypothetical protein n=1 Tax=Nocardia sp. NPDC051463 TaxID=3154845 RepID=UPI00344E3B5C
MDLNDWFRGERDWRDLWDLKDILPQGSRYRSAKLREPEVVEALAQLPEPTSTDIPLEGFDPLIARLANIEDLLNRLIFVTAHADAAAAPSAARPEMPHLALRRELKRRKATALEMRLISGGGDA